MNDRMICNLSLAFLAMVLTFGSLPALAQEQIFDMRGTWTGQSTIVVSGPHKHTGHDVSEAKFYDVSVTYRIDSQEGRRFVGKKISSKHTETIIGVISQDNKSFYAVDHNGYMIGKINSLSEIETYYLEATPPTMVSSANKLKRQK
ncbi:MAG: hypothetical protein V1766_10275 [Pseudomonadota bacterium]